MFWVVSIAIVIFGAIYLLFVYVLQDYASHNHHYGNNQPNNNYDEYYDEDSDEYYDEYDDEIEGFTREEIEVDYLQRQQELRDEEDYYLQQMHDKD